MSTFNVSASQVIEAARKRMKAAYGKLPQDYFDKKDGWRYLFNNIEFLLDLLPPADVVDDAVRRAEMSMNGVSLYLGVPWCERICSFCNFAYSTKNDRTEQSAYVDDLREEVATFLGAGGASVRSLYFGGGTPTYLTTDLLHRHLTQAISLPQVVAGAGVTCEFSTSTIDESKIAAMVAAGVTRISTGVQSLDDGTRARANLVGTGRDALRAVDLVLDRLPNFNADLIYGHPYQSDEDWFDTVATLATRDVPSITLYRLELKERTTFKKIYIQHSNTLTDEMRARHHYFIAREVLEACGYEERPLGWWIKKASLGADPSWLNYLGVWKNSTPYVGFGLGAFTVGSSYHWRNESKRELWENKVRSGRIAAASIAELPPAAIVLNQFMRHVRTTRSIMLSAVADEFEQLGLMPSLRDTVQESLEWGLMEPRGDQLLLTEAGESTVHWIFGELLTRACDDLGLSRR